MHLLLWKHIPLRHDYAMNTVTNVNYAFSNRMRQSSHCTSCPISLSCTTKSIKNTLIMSHCLHRSASMITWENYRDSLFGDVEKDISALSITFSLRCIADLLRLSERLVKNVYTYICQKRVSRQRSVTIIRIKSSTSNSTWKRHKSCYGVSLDQLSSEWQRALLGLNF